jgi:ADP-ribosylation factor GTPase-activating protein 1
MDKWKDIELEKMKVGGNRQAKEFFASQPDYNLNTMSLQQRYNSRAAALYRDKIKTEALGQTWSIDSSPAQNHASSSTNYSEKPSQVKIYLLLHFSLEKKNNLANIVRVDRI